MFGKNMKFGPICSQIELLYGQKEFHDNLRFSFRNSGHALPGFKIGL